jgi:hypothetical protein
MNRAAQTCFFRHTGTHQKRLCLNSDRPVSSATRPCPPIHSKPASAAMNARFAQAASKQFCSTFARTVVAALSRGQFVPRPIGRATIASGKTRRAARSGIARSTPLRTRCLQRPSGPSRPKRDSFGDVPDHLGASDCESRLSCAMSQVRHLTRQSGGGRSLKARATALLLMSSKPLLRGFLL